MRLALKFGYDGTGFHGYQRQPGLRTVEGEILGAMGELGACGDPRAAGFASASRTDAGVSAIGNVIALDTHFRTPGLIRALNSKLGDIWFWGFAEVPSSFNPRHARERWYRYYLPRREGFDIDLMRRAARLFEGRHDLGAFTRARGNTVRSLRTVTITPSVPWILLDFRGEAFLWNLVRRLVAALGRVGLGKADPADVAAALQGRGGDFGLAPPWGLVLMDVTYDQPFHVVATRPSVARIIVKREQHLTRAALFAELLARMGIGGANFGNV
jgi:tRNA pseudouridine38-40 synthase